MPTLKKQLWGLLPIGLILVGLFVVLVAVPYAVQYLGRAAGVPANIIVDTTAILGPMPRPWRSLAQGGEELTTNMMASVVEKTKALKPEYIRLDHLYDGYNIVSRGGDGSLAYDWSRLDAVVNDILKTGAKPFLSLSYMPLVISKGDIVEQPKDYNDWAAVVRATVEHYSGRGNLNISDVYYEVWNEPDLFGGWKTYGDKNYLTLYRYSSAGARAATNVNSFKLGGPGTTALYKAWVDNFLNFMANNNLKYDFYSWHRYAKDLEQYDKDRLLIDGWLDAHPEALQIELIVTEWGHNSDIDPGYDTNFGAIHTMAGSRVMMGRINKAFIFEIKDGPGNSKLWGRWGLMTNDKFGAPEVKPRYNAILFLNRLGDSRLSLSGEGSWVKGIAANNNGVVQTLLINYDQTGRHSEAVPVTFENLQSGNFTYKRTNFGGGVVKTVNVATTSATWQTSELMSPNSAALLEISF